MKSNAMAQSKYYSNGQLLSYHYFLNFIIGHRGVGKSYDFKKWSIRDFLKSGKQFVWVRRYKQETKKIKQFFDDVGKEFPNNNLQVKGGDKDGVFMVDGKVAGYYLTLSISTSYKSIPFPNVDKIIFDEFLIDKSTYRYMSNEVIILLELIDTIFRDRDDVKGVFCLGNNISFTNPYFLYFGILAFSGRFYKKGEVLVECYRNEIYIENKKSTRFGRLVNGTTYGDYAIENKSLKDDNTFIEKRPNDAQFRFLVKYKYFTIGYWLDAQNGLLYACREYDPKTHAKYCLTREDHEPNLYLIKNLRNTHINDLKFMFQNGLLRFSDSQVKNVCYEILAYFVR